MAKQKVENEKLVAILSWFFPIGLIWYFADAKMKKSDFAKFHVKQSLICAIASIVLSIIPFIGWLISLVLWVIGLMSAIKGTKKLLPVIGKLAEKWFKF